MTSSPSDPDAGPGGDPTPSYELSAIRYATRDARRADHFIGGDAHDGPMPMDYYIWVARNAQETVLIDIGCTRSVAERRGRTYLRDPIDALAALGVVPEDVADIVITHLHYDHVGSLSRFPNATFHIQKRELAFATGPDMRHRFLSRAFEVDDVTDMVRLNFAGRVRFHDGVATCQPGITLHLVGGHTHGLQFVRVHTKRGWVVLASDVAHFFENITSSRPFTIAYHVGEMLDGFDALRAAAPSPDHIVPGHDPLVMARYPAVAGDAGHSICRLDDTPTAAAPRPAPNATEQGRSASGTA